MDTKRDYSVRTLYEIDILDIFQSFTFFKECLKAAQESFKTEGRYMPRTELDTQPS